MSPFDDSGCVAEFGRSVEAFARAAGVAVASVSNLNTRIEFVGSGDSRVPVSVNSSEQGNDTWVCSPHTTYIRYATEELERFAHPSLTRPLQAVCRSLGRYLW